MRKKGKNEFIWTVIGAVVFWLLTAFLFKKSYFGITSIIGGMIGALIGYYSAKHIA